MLPVSKYEKMMNAEISHYSDLYENDTAKESLNYATPKVWQCVEDFVTQKIYSVTRKRGFIDYCVDSCKGKNGKLKVLSLGSGPCPMELNHLMPRLAKNSELTGLDINEDVLKIAEKKAGEKEIKFSYIVQDINKLSLVESSFDLIICYASLHHFLQLDLIAWEINKALKPDGEFVTVDICSRNGYLLWEENKSLVDSLFSALPEQYRLNYYTKKADSVFQDKDYSLNSFECINSEAIVPALEKKLSTKHFIPMTGISRRFFDHMYGYNFDLGRNFDRAFVDMVLALDDIYISSRKLKPETFFGAYTKKSEIGEKPPKWQFKIPKSPSLLSRAIRKINYLYRKKI